MQSRGRSPRGAPACAALRPLPTKADTDADPDADQLGHWDQPDRSIRHGAFQVLAFGGMWRRFKSESVTVRLVPYVCVMAAGVVIAYLGYKSFVTNLSNFLDVLLVIFIPWSAVNLADYFLVRGGNYDVASFFVADGVYGRFAWRGLLAYAMGLGAEWPFVYQPDYTGPLVKALGGADISWLVGWFTSAIVYLLLVTVSAGTARYDRQAATIAR